MRPWGCAIDYHGCLWEGTRACRTDASLFKINTANDAILEWCGYLLSPPCSNIWANEAIGLMYLAINDMQAIRSVIDMLRIPSLETRVCLSFRFLQTTTWAYNLGSYSRHVLWITQNQDVWLVSNFHSWSETHEYAVFICLANNARSVS